MESNEFTKEQGAESPHEARTTHPRAMDVSKPLDPKPTVPVAPIVAPEPPKPPKKLSLTAILIVAAALLVAGAAGYGIYALTQKDATTTTATTTATDENKNINTSGYQALFLTNGQVYFGHLSNLDNKFVTITDIYYLQVQQNLQQGSGGNTNSQVSLAKLGSELHGPEDKMHVASDQVLFWENLKPDSKVSQAINAYKKQ
ncbi:hypothetical protein EYC59_02215 [Candidatus Saccharibacteria bacterium]|nr:MAG: hypothetical protein EYC59_02215 [Candidatus Saccharibacteria bacterium]